MIIIIDNYDSFTYNLYQLVAAYHEKVCVIRNDSMTANEILNLNPQGIILSPGPGRPEDAGVCVALIQHVHRMQKNIALLGVCLGHQAIAHAFGGRVINAHDIVHGKKSFIFHSRKGIYKNLALPFAAGRYHSLVVEKNSLPKDIVIEAESDQGIIMGIKHQTQPIYGVQFHPESILTPDGMILIKNFICELETIC